MLNSLDGKLKCGTVFLSSVEQVLSDIRSVNNGIKVKHSVSFLNPFSYLQLMNDFALQECINEFYADGSLLCLCHRIKDKPIVRASFDYSSIAEPFLNLVASRGCRVAIIGATADELNLAVSRIKNKFTNINIVFSSHGYISSYYQIEAEFLESRPDVIIVGMGSPNQEDFIRQLYENYGHSYLAISCGGFLTQTSIRDDYYWPIVKRFGFRWLQRMIMHRHVRKRIYKDYPLFLIKYFISCLKVNK
jgi:UDP-Gal:alpha-D-GlcNAc-diphosphoundecaprenol beta-1,4-galactosyltransferase